MRMIKSEKGMTIVEIIVALAILGIVAVGFMGFFTNSFKFQARNQEIAMVQKVTDEIFEELKNSKGTISLDREIDITNITSEQGSYNDDYNYKIEVVSSGEVEEGVKLYDVTLTIINSNDSTITGSVNSTIRVLEGTQGSTGSGSTGSGEEINKINMKYDAAGGNGAPPSREISKKGKYSISIGTPYKTNYEFDKWEYNGNYYSAGSYIDVTQDMIEDGEDIVLVAKWTGVSCTVTFDANGGTCGTTSTVVKYNETIGSLPSASRSGYTFNGWYTNKTGGGQITASTQVTSIQQTVYAHWTKNSSSSSSSSGTSMLGVEGEWDCPCKKCSNIVRYYGSFCNSCNGAKCMTCGGCKSCVGTGWCSTCHWRCPSHHIKSCTN